MLALISPAKTLDFQSQLDFKFQPTQPIFQMESEFLVSELKGLSVSKISKMMKISQKLGELNLSRFQNWSRDYDNLEVFRPAILAFKGEVCLGLQAETLTNQELEESQSKLRILCGLYGILKPFDLIQPYRLDMGSDFKFDVNDNLYDFWGDRITDEINKIEEKVVINLASKEYFKSVNVKKLKARLINIVFKEIMADGSFKTIVLWTKHARGSMVRYIIQNKVENPEDLKFFNGDGYSFYQTLSTENEWVFVRKNIKI